MKTWQRFTLYTLYIIMFVVSFFIMLSSCENINLLLFTGISTVVFMLLIISIKDDYWEAVNKLLNKFFRN